MGKNDEDECRPADDLAAIANSPAAQARLNEKIQVGLDELARGEGVDGEAVFAALGGH